MNMEYYPGRKRRKVYRPIIFILFVIVMVICFAVLIMRPMALNAAVYRGKIIITKHLQETVIEALESPVSYEELVNIKIGRVFFVSCR